MHKLKKGQIILLKKCILNQDPSLLNLITIEELNNLQISQYNQLRDLVCDELIVHGFLADGEITDYGLQLEALIDDLGHYII